MTRIRGVTLPRGLQLLSWIGLAVSLTALAASTPKLVEEGGGWWVILGNLAQYGWTIALLAVVFAKRGPSAVHVEADESTWHRLP